MPVYNMERFVAEAIGSVLGQSYENWELLIIDDGSTDGTLSVIKSFEDDRIILICLPINQGVSASRNKALKIMTGSFICFLDGDDLLSSNSIQSRLDIMLENHSVDFVDGTVRVFKDNHEKTHLKDFTPSLKGNPRSCLLNLSEACFFGPTWMIRRRKELVYRFDESLSHGEDWLFYFSVSESNNYAFTNDITYFYRDRTDSAMSNLKKLEDGYFQILEILQQEFNVQKYILKKFKRKVKAIMAKSYLSEFKFFKALRVIIR